MMSAEKSPVRFHLSLNVSSLDRAVPYFEKLLRMSVTKRRDDYAKFELESPPLVLSLEPNAPAQHGSLNHLGFRAADVAELMNWQKELEAAGITTNREDGVECCYSKQTKFWVHDFDQRLWEFYVLEQDLEHKGGGQSLESMIGTAAATECDRREPVVWEHLMGMPLSPPQFDCDEIHFRGTFNQPELMVLMEAILKRFYQSLVPGGRISLHLLTSEEELPGPPQLSGPAAMVRSIPLRVNVLRGLETAGFQGIQLTTFRSQACFVSNGIPLRETRIEAIRPLAAVEEVCTVIFKGPFKQITDDAGVVWNRGEPTTVSADVWHSLKSSSMGDLFVLLPDVALAGSCGG